MEYSQSISADTPVTVYMFSDVVNMVTTMGTRIPMTALTAQLENCDAVEIRDQNFGFDPEHGILQVTLDPKEPEYYINVTKK